MRTTRSWSDSVESATTWDSGDHDAAAAVGTGWAASVIIVPEVATAVGISEDDATAAAGYVPQRGSAALPPSAGWCRRMWMRRQECR